MLLGATTWALSTTATIRASPTAAVVVVLPIVLVVVLTTRLTVSVARMLGTREHGLRRIRDGTRDILGRIVDVELLVDDLRDGLNLGTQLLLNLVQIETIFPVDQVDGQTQVAKTSGTTDTVKIGLGILREVKVNHHIDRLNINTTGQQVRADQVTTHAVAEVMEHAITVLLEHPSVRVEARIA